MSRLPLIGVTACSKQIGLHAYHISGDKYVRAVASAAKGLPVIFRPWRICRPRPIFWTVWTASLYRLSFNIEPFHYSGPANRAGHCS